MSGWTSAGAGEQLESARLMLVTHEEDGRLRVGVVVRDRLVDLDSMTAAGSFGLSGTTGLAMNDVIDNWTRLSGPIREVEGRLAAHPDLGRPVSGCRLVAPIPRPRRNPFLIAGNYSSHVQEAERATGSRLSERKQAIFFTKPSGTVVGPTADIEFDPKLTQKLDYEAEFVVVVGRSGRDISLDRAIDHVFGYMIGNDVSARDIQIVKPTTDYLRGKGLDTFFPTGPGVVPKEYLPEYHRLRIRLFLNGVLKQDAVLGEMTRDVAAIIAELSQGLTLEAGDIIATGTPGGVLLEAGDVDGVWLRDGDEVCCEIEGIGRLVNHVRAIP